MVARIPASTTMREHESERACEVRRPTPDITTDSRNNLASLRDHADSWTRDAREKVYDCCRDLKRERRLCGPTCAPVVLHKEGRRLPQNAVTS